MNVSCALRSLRPLMAAALVAAPVLAFGQYDLDKHFTVEGRGTGKADLDAQEAELAWYRASFDYNRPFQDVPYDPTREIGFFWGLQGDYTRLDFSGGGLSGFEDYDLYRLWVPLQLLYRPGGESGSWIFGGSFSPGIASDLGGASLDDFTFNAMLSALYRFNDRFEAGVGVYYGTDFGSPILLPGIGFRWKPTDSLILTLLPPIASAKWQMSENWSSELYVRPSGGYWHLHDSDVEGAEYIGHSSWLAGLQLERSLGESGAFFVGGGVTLRNRVELDDDDGDKIIGSDVDSAPFVRVGYRWEF